jgi:hypothetical protein
MISTGPIFAAYTGRALTLFFTGSAVYCVLPPPHVKDAMMAMFYGIVGLVFLTVGEALAISLVVLSTVPDGNPNNILEKFRIIAAAARMMLGTIKEGGQIIQSLHTGVAVESAGPGSRDGGPTS